MVRILLVTALCLVSFNAYALSDSEIKQKIIDQSIRNYSGSCACPYNTDRAGRKCGKRSAYSKPGGASPICYPGDVSADMIKNYRESNGG